MVFFHSQALTSKILTTSRFINNFSHSLTTKQLDNSFHDLVKILLTALNWGINNYFGTETEKHFVEKADATHGVHTYKQLLP